MDLIIARKLNMSRNLYFVEITVVKFFQIKFCRTFLGIFAEAKAPFSIQRFHKRTLPVLIFLL